MKGTSDRVFCLVALGLLHSACFDNAETRCWETYELQLFATSLLTGRWRWNDDSPSDFNSRGFHGMVLAARR